jgi:hypothetical protein
VSEGQLCPDEYYLVQLYYKKRFKKMELFPFLLFSAHFPSSLPTGHFYPSASAGNQEERERAIGCVAVVMESLFVIHDAQTCCQIREQALDVTKGQVE